MHIWTQFRGTPLGELVTGTAHEAHPADITTPLGVRFAGRTLLAIHLALERAATVRVSFGSDGSARLGAIRNISQRSSAEFVETVRAEMAATHAQWAVVVMATGWQAVLGQRSARPDPSEPGSRFSRHRLMFETPELVVTRAQVDRVYTAVDHPLLDKAIAFSVRRRDLEDVFAELRRCGLGVAGVRISVAAQLESWLATQGEAGLARDLLLTDGLSALLLNVEQGDFVAPRGVVETEQPRQSVQRPGEVEEDIARFVTSNTGRPVTFLGPEELCAAVKKRVPEVELVRPQSAAAHDVQSVALTAAVRHDLNFEARDVRPSLPKPWRRLVVGYAALLALLAGITAVNAFYAVSSGYESYRLERAAAEERSAADADTGATARLAADFAEASSIRSWVAANYHAQPFCYRLLKQLPPEAALERLLIEVKDGQITLTFAALGDQDMQLATHRAVESAIKELRYKIGSEDLPVAGGGPARSVQYRLHIILPDAGEAQAP